MLSFLIEMVKQTSYKRDDDLVILEQNNQPKKRVTLPSISNRTDEIILIETDELQYGESLVSANKHFFSLFANFVEEQHQKFDITIKDFKCYVKAIELQAEFKKYKKSIQTSIKTSNTAQCKNLTMTLIVYFVRLSNGTDLSIFLKDIDLKNEIINIVTSIDDIFMKPLFIFENKENIVCSMKKWLPIFFTSEVNKSTVYQNYELKLNKLNKEYDLKYDKITLTKRANRIKSLFIDMENKLETIISIVAVLLKYGDPEILFIYSFFYFEIKEAKAIFTHGQKYTLDRAFFLIINQKVTLDMLIKDVTVFNTSHVNSNVSQEVVSSSNLSLEKLTKMEDFFNFIIKKYNKEENKFGNNITNSSE